jgi:uncharacterized membrane protein YgaE (UPF0421/DUF939 family)
MAKGLSMTQLDIALWLGMICVALAMISFRWGTARGIVAILVTGLLVPLSLMSLSNLLPELGVVVALFIAAVVPSPKQSAVEQWAQTSRAEAQVLR